jgi:outer membrane receptor protein involved in Fe transport
VTGFQDPGAGDASPAGRGAAVDTTATAADNCNFPNIAEMVFTAQKRVQRLQDLPISMEVLSGAKLTAPSFGKNTAAGAVSVVTRGLTDTFQGAITGLYDYDPPTDFQSDFIGFLKKSDCCGRRITNVNTSSAPITT